MEDTGRRLTHPWQVKPKQKTYRREAVCFVTKEALTSATALLRFQPESSFANQHLFKSSSEHPKRFLIAYPTKDNFARENFRKKWVQMHFFLGSP
jgi:hypothetical protein